MSWAGDSLEVVTFTDDAGRAWTVHDFSVIGGKIQWFPVGDLAAQYRGFAPIDRGARRRYVFKTGDPHAPLPRELEGQLRLSVLDWRDDPKHYETPARCGVQGREGAGARGPAGYFFFGHAK